MGPPFRGRNDIYSDDMFLLMVSVKQTEVRRSYPPDHCAFMGNNAGLALELVREAIRVL
jgi:hypothetical protein